LWAEYVVAGGMVEGAAYPRLHAWADGDGADGRYKPAAAAFGRGHPPGAATAPSLPHQKQICNSGLNDPRVRR